jgi:hypothetical protein
MEEVDTRHLRPTFTMPVRLGRADTIEGIRAGFVARDHLSGRWRGKGRWAELYVPARERKLWSPYLSLRVDEDADGCSVFGRFSPHPEVWTFFMFIYGSVVTLVVFGATFGYVQWASGTPAWGLWAVWLGVPLLALLHGASWLGQRLGREQMSQLQAEVEDVLEELAETAD